MKQRNHIRITKFDIIWNYLGYGLSFGVNIILLPLILHFLSSEELGLWYVFMSINSLILMLDFGFTPQLTRFITYSYSGSTTIQKDGLSNDSNLLGDVNVSLLNKVLSISKIIFLFLATASFVLLSTVGTIYINHISDNNYDSTISWYIFCLACFINLFFYYYNAYFRGTGQFIELNKAIVLSKIAQIICCIILFILGYGILGLSIAYLLSTIIYRVILSYFIKKNSYINSYTIRKMVDEKKDLWNELKKIWHNAWREGLVTVSRFGVTQSNVIICSIFLGLSEVTPYALSMQITSIIASLSSIYYSTIQPSLSQVSLLSTIKEKFQIFAPAWLIYVIAFMFLAVIIAVFAPFIFTIIKSNTEFDRNIFIIVALFVFLETNHSLFASYISTSNKVPYTKSYIVSAVFAVNLSVLFIKYSSLGIWSLIGSHFIVQLLYNNWKWPSVVLKEASISFGGLIRLGFIQIIQKIKGCMTNCTNYV
jgi:O-antigen/teichoic acid export membrane protein